MFKTLIFPAAVFLVFGCSQVNSDDQVDETIKTEISSELQKYTQRPAFRYCPTRADTSANTMCNAQYLPVCGVMSTGEVKEYSNACNACVDTEVVGYAPIEACQQN